MVYVHMGVRPWVLKLGWIATLGARRSSCWLRGVTSPMPSTRTTRSPTSPRQVRSQIATEGTPTVHVMMIRVMTARPHSSRRSGWLLLTKKKEIGPS